MKREENIRAILECNLPIVQTEILDTIVKNIMALEPCEDTISRQAVIERLKKEDKIIYTTNGLNYLIRAIEELPSVTQKSETVTEFADRCRECGAKYGKLLKQEPCKDAISRQAVLEQTYNWSKDEFLRVTNPFDYLRKRINALPSVSPQESITERIEYGTDGNPYVLSMTNGKELEHEPILDKIKGYINHIKNTGMGKEKSLEFIVKFIDGQKAESEDKV